MAIREIFCWAIIELFANKSPRVKQAIPAALRRNLIDCRIDKTSLIKVKRQFMIPEKEIRSNIILSRSKK
jgi:hypothetical protein